jgi:hypothetical protein
MSYDPENHVWWNDNDTDSCFYLEDSHSLEEISKKIQLKWPECDLSKIRFAAESINVRGCGCHAEPGDYDTFIRIEKLL